jgi:hypothetical protein
VVREPEKLLGDIAFRSPDREDLLAINSPNDISIVLEAFEKFSRLDEFAMVAWLKSSVQSYGMLQLNERQAERLGILLFSKRWSDAAQVLRKALSTRRDLAPAVRECISLFGIFERLALCLSLPGRSRFNFDEFWDALELELVSVYPLGPMQEELWDRSGGDDSTLTRDGSGQQQWRTAIRLLRQGGGGKKINIRRLLKKVRSDFPSNDRFLALENYAREANI